MKELYNTDFFEDITSQIVDNPKRLSYGVSVTDVNQDGSIDVLDVVMLVGNILSE